MTQKLRLYVVASSRWEVAKMAGPHRRVAVAPPSLQTRVYKAAFARDRPVLLWSLDAVLSREQNQ